MMDETTALTGTTTTTTTTKEKKGYTPLVVLFMFAIILLFGLALLYAGQPMHGGTSLAAAGGGTTRGGATTAASLTLMSNESFDMNDDDTLATCVKSEGTYDSQTDFCYTCGSKKEGTLGYCWNSQLMQCPPACDNVQGVSGIGDNQCGDACDKFLYENGVLLASQ